MTDELKLEHKTLDEAIKYHSTFFEYALNMGHFSDQRMAASSAFKFFEEAAVHAGILAELRHHRANELQHQYEDNNPSDLI